MKVAFEVDGRPVELSGEPTERLLDVLRERLGLTGTREGCGEGDCGSCTVLLDGEPVLACLVPLLQTDGARVETIDGLGRHPGGRELLERFLQAGAVQCGFCSAGLAMTSAALLRNNPQPGRLAVRDALSGNLCRCTGYEAWYRALVGGVTGSEEDEP